MDQVLRRSWTKDGKGFFYNRFDEPKPGAEYQTLNFNNKLCYHRVGTPQSADVLVYFRPEQRKWRYEGRVTDDGRYLMIEIYAEKGDRARIMVRDLAEPYGMPIDVIDNFKHQYHFVGNVGPLLYFTTDLNAPRHRLVAIDLNNPKLAGLEGNHPGIKGHPGRRFDGR